MADYPGAITVLPLVEGRDLAAGILGDVVKSEDMNKHFRETEAIENELGINPKGIHADVAARLVAIEGAAGGGVNCATATVGESEDCDYVIDADNPEIEINHAISDVSATGGGVVFVKGGTYLLQAPIIPLSNVILEGEGNATKFMRGALGIKLFFHYFTNPVVENMVFRNFCVDTAGAQSTDVAFYFEGPAKMRFDHINFYGDGDYGLHLWELGRHYIISHCNFSGFKFPVVAHNASVDVNNCIFFLIWNTVGLKLTGGNFFVSNNTFNSDSAGNGIACDVASGVVFYFSNRCIEINTGIDLHAQLNCKVISNYFKSCSNSILNPGADTVDFANAVL